MKTYILIPVIFFICCCAKQKASPEGDENFSVSDSEKPLIIGGIQYNNRFKKDHPDKKALTLGDIDDIEFLYLEIDPIDNTKMSSLEGIEQLYNAKNIEKISFLGRNLDKTDLSPLEQFNYITHFTVIINGSIRFLPNLSMFKSLRVLGILNVNFDQYYVLHALPYLTYLTIDGTNLKNVDLSAIETMHDLQGLRLAGNISRLPDLTELENLHSITIGTTESYAALESLEGIGAPNMKSITITNNREIDSFAPLNNLVWLEKLEISGRLWGNVYKIADMANLPNLKCLMINGYAEIDLQGVENMSALEKINLFYAEPYNMEGIEALNNLKTLWINLVSSEPSIEFLRNMPNLIGAAFYADVAREGYPNNTDAYQILDVSPLATVKNLRKLECTNFIIKNISALDILEELTDRNNYWGSFISLFQCRLYNEKEESKHRLVFEMSQITY